MVSVDVKRHVYLLTYVGTVGGIDRLTCTGSHGHLVGVNTTLMVSGHPRGLDACLVTLQHVAIDQHLVLAGQHAHVDVVHLRKTCDGYMNYAMPTRT